MTSETFIIVLATSPFKPNPYPRFGLHTVMTSKEDDFPVGCNLLTPDSCEYKRMGNKDFTIKYKNGLGYPFKYYYLIYEIKSSDFYRGIDYHINLYRKNKIYAVIYLIFIVLASIIFVFVIPMLILSSSKDRKYGDFKCI